MRSAVTQWRAERTRSPKSAKVRLVITVAVDSRTATSVAKALGSELGEDGRAEVVGDELKLTLEGLTLSDAMAALNSHLRVLKAAIDSIRAIDIP